METPDFIKLLKLYQDYVGDCILLAELGHDFRPVGFDRWYDNIYLRNIRANPNFYATTRHDLIPRYV